MTTILEDMYTMTDCGAHSEEITEWDQNTYLRLISTNITDEQRRRITAPPRVYTAQDSVLAVHWHPEHVPMDISMERVNGTFPNKTTELVIPTQHNTLMSLNGFSGVEVDCYSKGFNLKAQLLIHMSDGKAQKADVFRAMLAHTFKYRSSQLFEFMDTITEPAYEERLQKAATETVAKEGLIAFVRCFTRKLRKLIEANEAVTPPEALKNNLLFMYFDELRALYEPRLINKARLFLMVVKQKVKREFSLEYFCATEDVIEEARALGAGIVIPHPEQFWPILLADYDVDGYEVWNPQSRQYTEFIIQVVSSQNHSRKTGRRPLLVFMGDDTHMSEKARPPEFQDPEKSSREIGVQPGWEDAAIRKSLITARMDRRRVIEEYAARIS